jgi:hypothetical protein
MMFSPGLGEGAGAVSDDLGARAAQPVTRTAPPSANVVIASRLVNPAWPRITVEVVDVVFLMVLVESPFSPPWEECQVIAQ